MGGRRQSTSTSAGTSSSRQPHGGLPSNALHARSFAALHPRKHALPLGASPPNGDVTARSTTSTQSTPPGLALKPPPPLRPPTAGNMPPTPRTGHGSATPRGGRGGNRPTTPATLPLVNLPHARQAFSGNGPTCELPPRGKQIATPRGGVSIPLLRLGGSDAPAAVQTPRNRAAQKAQQQRPMPTPRGRGGRSSSGGVLAGDRCEHMFRAQCFCCRSLAPQLTTPVRCSDGLHGAPNAQECC